MLTHQDPSMSASDIHRNDISIIREDNQPNKRSECELDELQASRARQLTKKAAKFLVSHVGLVGLVVAYAIAGGFLFKLLEQHRERLNCQEAYGEHMVQLTKLKQKIVAYIQYNTTSSATASVATYSTEKDNATVAYAKIGSMLYDYRDFVIATGSKYRYYGDDCSVVNKWTYPNSLLFAITIITTIGYGNITPMTWEGQICCICYATIGIPIFLLCVANISGVLGEMFRLVYAQVLCRPCYKIKKQRALARKAKLEEETGISVDRMNARTWNINDNNNNNFPRKSVNMFMDEIDTNEDENLSDNRVNVPLTITMLIIAAYIWAGALIFRSFEQWSISQAGYFCFITLATIGFGDFVPGQRKDDPRAGGKLIVGAIYVLFGMAILAMCFDLMQEEIVAKFRWIGRKIGIVDNEEEPPFNPKDQMYIDPRHLSITSSIAGSNQAVNINGKILDDESENGWPTQRTSIGTRKLSPRNNSARVHPIETGSNEGTLHQRASTTKSN